MADVAFSMDAFEAEKREAQRLIAALEDELAKARALLVPLNLNALSALMDSSSAAGLAELDAITDQYDSRAPAPTSYNNSCFELTDEQKDVIRRSEAAHRSAFANWKSVATLPIASLRSPNTKPLFLERMVRDARQLSSPSSPLASSLPTPPSHSTAATTPSLPIIPKERSKYADADESYDDFEDTDKPDTPMARITTPQQSIAEDDNDASFQLNNTPRTNLALKPQLPVVLTEDNAEDWGDD